jgi:hypothetical protein
MIEQKVGSNEAPFSWRMSAMTTGLPLLQDKRGL